MIRALFQLRNSRIQGLLNDVKITILIETYYYKSTISYTYKDAYVNKMISKINKTEIDAYEIETSSDSKIIVTYSENDWIRLHSIQWFFYICFACYVTCIILGIPCNLFVISRMCRLTSRSSEIRNGSGICLMIMSVADIVSLTTIVVHLVIKKVSLSNDVKNVMCKSVLFSTHFATSVSIWCWLLLSTLRYLSIHYPFIYIRIWHLPLRVLSVVVSVAFITNLWLLFGVNYDITSMNCTAEDVFSIAILRELFLSIEMTWSFCIPSVIIIYADASALLCWIKLTKTRKESTAILRRNRLSTRRKPSRRQVWKWLFLALIDVFLNAPENIIRFCTIVGIITENNSDTTLYYMLRILSQE
uniref:G_PROTEIN_RECEP_F1_2 domain-containing protein n=1 Tax=Syphacia muris TaxID=451379 RepID=A0A0N5B0N5_9BILA